MCCTSLGMKLEPPFPPAFFTPQTGLEVFCHLPGDVRITHGLHFVDLPEKLRSCAVHITIFYHTPRRIHGLGYLPTFTIKKTTK